MVGRATFGAGVALVVAMTTATVTSAARVARVPSDPTLLAALRSDAAIASCSCVRTAGWLDESYPRVTVDATRWKRLAASARRRIVARALVIAEKTYLSEFAAEDQYREIVFLDARGNVLADYEP